MGRKVMIGLLVIILIIAIGTTGFQYKGKVHITEEGKEKVYFTASFWGYHIQGIHQGPMGLGLNLLEISREALDNPRILKYHDQVYITYILKDRVRVFDFHKGLVDTFTLEDPSNRIVSSAVSDLDGDEEEEVLLIEGKGEGPYGERLLVLTYDQGFTKILDQSFEGMNPWKVQTADVDGDGAKEISVGVYKTTRFHPVMAKRPFIYNWHGNAISPKWRGSRLSKPFDDYIFYDIDDDGMDEIVSIERLQEGRRVINTYKWKGFGFEGMTESQSFENIVKITKGSKNQRGIYALVEEDNKVHWVVFDYGEQVLSVTNQISRYLPEDILVID